MAEAADIEAGVAIVMLAGGQAHRFPGKLEYPIQGVPLAVRTYRVLRATGWPVYIAANNLSRELDALLDAPRLADRRPGGGPLQAFVWACHALDASRIFAVAADLPNLRASVLHQLAAAWRLGDEAIVPVHDGYVEPLAALYSRDAALREGFRLRRGNGAMHALVGRLSSRFVACDPWIFYNVNRPQDVAAIGVSRA